MKRVGIHLGIGLGGGGGGLADGPIGGYKPGDAGAAGTIYEGFTLSWGEDFNRLDIVGPSTPYARFFPTSGYGAGIRGNLGSRGTAQDVDPLWTGHNDANRGKPIGYDNMKVAGSVLRLGARKATAAEQAFFEPTDPSINGGVRPQVSSIIHTAGAIAWYPTTNAIIVEFKAAFSPKTTNPPGFHPALWFFTTMLRAADGNEHDLEGTSQGLYHEVIDHTGGVVNTPRSASNGPYDYFDGVMRTFTLVMQNAASGGLGPIQFYVDGVAKTPINLDANTKSKLITAVLSSHIVNGNFNGDVYSQAAWDASASGAYIDIDYMRVWRKTGVTHWRPLAPVPDLNVAYNGTGSVVLPAAATLWGDGTVIEEVQVIQYDGYEPGMTPTTAYTTNLPAGVTYTAGTRTLAVDFSAGTGNAGRLHVCVYGYKQDGSTAEPLRFCINRGPNITATSLQPVPDGAGNVYVDVYPLADVGTVFPKSFSFTGLPGGWTYDPVTFRLRAALPAAGATITMTVTNGAGQTASKSLELWSPAMMGAAQIFAWNSLSTTSLVNDGSGKAQFLKDIYDPTKAIAQTTAANRPVIATNGGANGTSRFLSYLAGGVSMRSDDASASNIAGIKSFADTADVRTGDRYLCFVAKESAISTVNRVLGWFNNAGSQFLAFRYTTTGRGAQIQGAGGAAQTADQASQDTSWHVFEVIKTGATLVVKIDGTQVATVTITQTGGIAADLFILGGAQSGGAFVGGIGSGAVYNSLPAAADQTRERKRLAADFGITVV